MSVVVDASVALDWVLELERSDYGASVLAHVCTAGGRVPAIWPAEIANGLLTAMRRKHLKAADLPKALALLESVPLESPAVAPHSGVRRWLAAGEATGLSAHDAAYLELAQRESLPLATHDGALRKAAEKAGVELFVAP